jgi:hypothetical protein
LLPLTATVLETSPGFLSSVFLVDRALFKAGIKIMISYRFGRQMAGLMRMHGWFSPWMGSPLQTRSSYTAFRPFHAQAWSIKETSHPGSTINSDSFQRKSVVL